MKVILTGSAGFCPGVRSAVAKARGTVRPGGNHVFTDGPLMHNRQMMDQLEKEGIRETAIPESLPPGSCLVLRAHGIPPERRRFLQSLPLTLVDATCADVARIHGLIRMHVRRGFHILIFGDQGHPEVTGLLGYAEGRGKVISSPEDVRSLPESLSPVCMVSQSTQFPASYELAASAARLRFRDLVVLDTICDCTKARQSELLSIAERVDSIVVVGGDHSANTLRLFALARALRPAVHVRTAEDISPSFFANCTVVGLTAGASTPDFIIEEVRRKLEALS